MFHILHRKLHKQDDTDTAQNTGGGKFQLDIQLNVMIDIIHPIPRIVNAGIKMLKLITK